MENLKDYYKDSYNALQGKDKVKFLHGAGFDYDTIIFLAPCSYDAISTWCQDIINMEIDLIDAINSIP